ncbi:hypothetical protein CsSME_00034993 [Camellia sinensis var. sinensis]
MTTTMTTAGQQAYKYKYREIKREKAVGERKLIIINGGGSHENRVPLAFLFKFSSSSKLRSFSLFPLQLQISNTTHLKTLILFPKTTENKNTRPIVLVSFTFNDSKCLRMDGDKSISSFSKVSR